MDFLCNECAKTFAKEVDLVIHQARAHDKRSFSCKMCHVITVGYTNHNNHMRVHKPKKKTTRLLKCEKCYYETNQKQNLNRHILTVHNEKKDSDKSKNRSCPDCGKSFLQQRYLTRHKKIHRKGDENDIAVSSGFCFVWPFPLFSFSPTGEVQQPVERVRWGVNFGTYEKKREKKAQVKPYAANALKFLRIPGIWRNTSKEGTPRK